MKNRTAGFTLIELLIAMFVFTIFATLAAKGFRLIITNIKQTQTLSAQLRPIQNTLLILERDLQQTIDRPIWDENNKLIESFIADDHHVEFTHLGAHFADQNHHSQLERVRYTWDEKTQQWLRYHWEVLDRVENTQPKVDILLSGVTQVKIQFRDKQKTYDHWPPKQNNDLPFPKTIEIEFTLKNHGQLKHIFNVGGNKFA